MAGDVMCVVGARPNFMKVAPILRALDVAGVTHTLVHTGQHYDDQLSGVFFRDLDLPEADVHLGVGSGSHAAQTAKVMLAFEPELERLAPRCLVVVGDVNSTLACALVAAKRGVFVAHVEAGLRSGDRTMPEEVNRVLTDQLADLCLTPSPDADENLAREGIPYPRIRRVGNVMIDALVAAQPRAEARAPELLAGLGLVPHGYALVTLHRPSNVDSVTALARLLATLGRVGQMLPVLFPVHPRTRRRLEQFGLLAHVPREVRLVPPLGYVECLALEANARVVLTDSGGMQEETTFLQVPCLTLRETTERPITVVEGSNCVVGTDPALILDAVRAILAGERLRSGRCPALWDGEAASRIVEALVAAVLEPGAHAHESYGFLSANQGAATSAGAL
jgi:UDP-N-acetylglucosamine 2-epimerase (non-hydrolysing)